MGESLVREKSGIRLQLWYRAMPRCGLPVNCSVLPSEDSALLLLYGLAASGQLRFRKLDGYQELDQVGRVAA